MSTEGIQLPILTKQLLIYLSLDPAPFETAKFITTMSVVNPPPRATTISCIDKAGFIYELARFGLASNDPFLNRVSIWEDLPPLKPLVRGEIALIDPEMVKAKARSIGFEIQPDKWLRSVLMIPIFKKQIPIGAVGLFFDEPLKSVPNLEIDYESFQSLMSLAFETKQFRVAMSANRSSNISELTDREKQFIEWIAQGRSNKEIATLSQLALPTVKTRVSKLLTKYEVKNRKQLVDKVRTLQTD